MTDASASAGFYDHLAIWSQIVGALLFIVCLLWLFRTYLMPAVAAAQKSTNAMVDDLERRRVRAREDAEAARRELADAGESARLIHERFAADAARERERIVTEARREGERVVRNAENDLDRGRLAAQAALRERIIDEAIAIARDRARSAVDVETNARLIDGVIARLERGLS